MRGLTLGEKRYVYESTNSWRMYIYSQSVELSKEDEACMRKLEDGYQDAFYSYYENALKIGEVYNSGALQAEFEEVYKKEHPEFFDIEALIRR